MLAEDIVVELNKTWSPFVKFRSTLTNISNQWKILRIGKAYETPNINLVILLCSFLHSY